MNIVNTYELIYTGLSQPQHLLRAVKAESLSNVISAIDNARLAEYFLRVLDFDKRAQSKVMDFHLPNQDVSNKRLLDYVTLIHQAKSEEIRSRFYADQLNDSDASDLLFKLTLERELENVPGGVKEIEITV